MNLLLSKKSHSFSKKKNHEGELRSFLINSSILEFKSINIREGAVLGKGGFGKVIEGYYKSLKFAIKKLKHYDPKALLRELSIMKRYNHPSIPSLMGIITRPDFYQHLLDYFKNIVLTGAVPKRGSIVSAS